MPHVLLLNQYYAPDEAATAQMLADLGEGLAAAGCSVTAVCGDRSYGDPAKRYPARETIDGVDVRRVRTTGFGRGSFLARIADYLTFIAGAKMQLLFGPAPDVVVSLTTPPFIALLGTFLGRIRGAKTVFWSMDVYPDVAYELGAVRRGSLAGWILGKLAFFTHAMPDTVVALGETMKTKLEANGARNVVVIHNWTDGDAIRPVRPDENPLRREWGWDDRFVLMYSGNLGLGHEFETAMEGWAAVVVAEHSDVRPGPRRTASAIDSHAPFRARGRTSECSATPLLAFVGTGPRLAEVRARAAESGLTGTASGPPTADRRPPQSVEFRGYVPREALAHSLTAPDVHLVTMRDAMAGLIVPSKIYGILAAGRPTIYVGPAAGEIHDILERGECGIRVPIGDAAAFADAVRRYRDDPALRERHGENARRLHDARFTKARAIREWLAVVRG